MNAQDETSEHPQGGCGVKVTGQSAVSLGFVNKIGLGSAHYLKPTNHCGANNHRAISIVANAPLGHCVVAFVTLLVKVIVMVSAKWSRGDECGRSDDTKSRDKRSATQFPFPANQWL